jgi:hypothetical protein
LDGGALVQGRVWQVTETVLEVTLPGLVVAVLAALVMAVIRRRYALVLEVVVLVAGANITTQILKLFLDRPDLGLSDRIANSLPSGHTTVAASAAVALLLGAPRRFRPGTATLGAVYTSAMGISTLVHGWHRPADAIAAVLVVLAWSGLVIALGPRGSGFGRSGHVRPAVSLLGGTSLVLGAVAALAYAQVVSVTTWARQEQLIAFMGGSLGIAAMSAAAFGVIVALVAAADPA